MSDGPVPRIGRHVHFGASGTRIGKEKGDIPCMREIVFRVVNDRPGHLDALADTLPICISAPTLEELQHEAREILIHHLGPAHCTYRVRVQRPRFQSQPLSAIRPLQRQTISCP